MATTNVRQVTVALRSEGEGLLSAVVDELARLAQEAVNFMKMKAPKWRSTLTNSIRADKVADHEWSIGPGVDYGRAVEEGRGPGKGLPRFTDPAAADIVAWLTTKVFAGRRRARRTSMKAVHENLELRDRYQGLAWHVRHKGIKAHPYAAPTLDMMERAFPARLELAARRYLAGQQAGGGVA